MKQCCYIYHDFSSRWINLSRLSPDQWLRIVKLFELEVSARMIANRIGVAYNTAHRAVTILRMATLAHGKDAKALLSGGIELDESYFGGKRKGKRGRGAAGKVPVFGILSRGSQVFVQVVPD